MKRRLVILGAGGHAKVCADMARRLNFDIAGVLDNNSRKHGTQLLRSTVIGDDHVLRDFDPKDIYLVNGIGSVGIAKARRAAFQKHRDAGFEFVTLCHPSAIIGDGVTLGEGAQVMAGVVLQTDVRAGDNCIINSGAVVEHDCDIGNHAHIGPAAALSGNVRVGNESMVGVGACIMQGITIGHRCVVGAGAVVIRPVFDGTTVVGSPAHEKKL